MEDGRGEEVIFVVEWFTDMGLGGMRRGGSRRTGIVSQGRGKLF